MLLPGTVIQQKYRVIRALPGGGMADLFEVEDNQGVIKILKILKDFDQDEELIERLAQEADVLQRIDHSGVPIVLSDDGFFCYRVEGQPDPIYGFVMEKVDGHNLETWLQQAKHQRLSENQAINWLKQLAETLQKVHQCNFFHRDIKPANIMLRPNSQLVLIDFGIAREMTHTFWHQQKVQVTGTKYHSDGYAPPEQPKGKADETSDFYALGRTLIHLITGIHPHELAPTPESDRLRWRSKAPHISAKFADLLDWLTQRDRNLRPRTAQQILAAITQLSAPPHQLWIHHILWACGYGIVIGGMIVAIRWLGFLQPAELAAFDLTMQIRAVIAPEPPDPRLAIITIDEQDLAFQHAQQMQPSRRDQSLSDTALEQLLVQLDRYKPAVIGLDIYRDETTSAHPELIKRLQHDSRIIGVCMSKNSNNRQNGEAPPREVPQERIGLTDFVEDEDAVVRRQILFGLPEERSACQAIYSFSSRVALEYLMVNHQLILMLPNDELQVANIIFKSLNSRTGAYQNLSDSSQILLNYRSILFPDQIARSIPLRHVLTGNFDAEWFKNRIVLIGVALDSDRWTTPFSRWHRDTSGIIIHAHMVSQLLSAVLDHRPLLWTWSVWQDTFWIMGWGIAGGLLAKRASWRRIVFGGAIAGTIVIGFCSMMLIVGGWLPSLPAILGFSLVLTLISTNQYLVKAWLYRLIGRSQQWHLRKSFQQR